VKFHQAALAGAFVIEPERAEDDRGYFARTFCEMEFENRGLNPRVSQCSVSQNRRQGTLRGLHFQQAPAEETKLVRCPRGAIFDVVVDMRPESSTFGHWFAETLSALNGWMLYVPEGFAHGFQTLSDDVEVAYQISTAYRPELSGGIRWNDPRLGIAWPLPAPILSDRDRALPLFDELHPRGSES
jgi:dTDP-4-dehydrorhamnose 3,5-epimerase